MADEARAELIAEIESFRAELRRRADEHAHLLSSTDPLGLPVPDLSRLELSDAKDLVARRYADTRYERRLQEAERRLAVLEGRNG